MRPSPCARARRSARAARRAPRAVGSGDPDSPRSPSRRLVAEDERVRRRAVDEAERHTRVQRVHERALALDEQQLAATPRALDDEPLGGSGEEVGDDRVDSDPPAGDRDARLPGRDEDRVEAARSRLEVELDGDGLLADRAVGADGEDDLRVDLEIRSGRDVQAPRAACAGRAAPRRASARARPAPDRRRRTRAARSRRRDRPRWMPSGARARPAGSGRPASRRLRPRRSARTAAQPPPSPTIGIPSWLGSGALRVEDRDDRIGPVADDPAHRLPVVRVVGEPLTEDEEAPSASRREIY